MKYVMIIFLSFLSFQIFAQKRLELLETNVPNNFFTSYGDSYLWTKNWWLINGMIVDTSKGGNAIASKSKLSKAQIDSLGKEFRKFLSPKVARFGNLTPRIVFSGQKNQTPFIKASIYEIGESSVQLIAVYQIDFGSGEHNKMTDVLNITVMDPQKANTISFQSATALYSRKATTLENNITPPPVAN